MTHTKAVLTRLEQSVELVRVETSDTLMAHSEEAQQHYQQRGRDALLLLHLQVPQRLRKVKMVEKIDNICVKGIIGTGPSTLKSEPMYLSVCHEAHIYI